MPSFYSSLLKSIAKLPNSEEEEKVTIVYGKDENTGNSSPNIVVPKSEVKKYMPDLESKRKWMCECKHDRREHIGVSINEIREYGIKGGRCTHEGCECRNYLFSGVLLTEQSS